MTPQQPIAAIVSRYFGSPFAAKHTKGALVCRRLRPPPAYTLPPTEPVRSYHGNQDGFDTLSPTLRERQTDGAGLLKAANRRVHKDQGNNLTLSRI
jgi:hypothetical protein